MSTVCGVRRESEGKEGRGDLAANENFDASTRRTNSGEAF